MIYRATAMHWDWIGKFGIWLHYSGDQEIYLSADILREGDICFEFAWSNLQQECSEGNQIDPENKKCLLKIKGTCLCFLCVCHEVSDCVRATKKEKSNKRFPKNSIICCWEIHVRFFPVTNHVSHYNKTQQCSIGSFLWFLWHHTI